MFGRVATEVARYSAGATIGWTKLLSGTKGTKHWDSLFFSIVLLDTEHNRIMYRITFAGANANNVGFLESGVFTVHSLNSTTIRDNFPASGLKLICTNTGWELWVKPSSTYIWLSVITEFCTDGTRVIHTGKPTPQTNPPTGLKEYTAVAI